MMIDFSHLEFLHDVDIRDCYQSDVSSSEEGVYFIQGRDNGVRIVFEDEFPTIFVPWHMVKWATEEVE